jgi:hypothetical protein
MNDMDMLSTSHRVAPECTKSRYKAAPKAAPGKSRKCFRIVRPADFWSAAPSESTKEFPSNVKKQSRISLQMSYFCPLRIYHPMHSSSAQATQDERGNTNQPACGACISPLSFTQISGRAIFVYRV